MKPGMRRVLGSIGCVAFLIFWIWGAVTVADYLPDIMWLKLIYFAVAGTCWGFPLFPLIGWSSKPD